MLCVSVPIAVSLGYTDSLWLSQAFDKALHAGAVVENSLVKMLLTNSIIKDELIAADPRKKQQIRGGHNMGGMMSGMMGGVGF